MSCLKNILIFQHLLFWQKISFKTKDKKKNNELVELIKVSNLQDEIKKMSEDKKKPERPDKILKIVKEILEFNKKIPKKLGG